MSQTYSFKIDKLIRDKLPAIMRESGIHVSDRIMETDAYARRLKEKLCEEAQEVIDAACEKEICEKLADLLEVIRAMAQLMGSELTDIIALADQKRTEKGGFDNRIYSDCVQIPVGHPSLNYYLSRPNKYPEVIYEKE